VFPTSPLGTQLTTVACLIAVRDKSASHARPAIGLIPSRPSAPDAASTCRSLE
jgi:hypothetical protein